MRNEEKIQVTNKLLKEGKIESVFKISCDAF